MKIQLTTVTFAKPKNLCLFAQAKGENGEYTNLHYGRIFWERNDFDALGLSFCVDDRPNHRKNIFDL